MGFGTIRDPAILQQAGKLSMRAGDVDAKTVVAAGAKGGVRDAENCLVAHS